MKSDAICPTQPWLILMRGKGVCVCAWMYVCMRRPFPPPNFFGTGCILHACCTHKVTSRCDSFCDQWRPLQLLVVPRQRAKAPSDHPQTVTLGTGPRCACHHACTHAPHQHETSHVCGTGQVDCVASFPFCRGLGTRLDRTGDQPDNLFCS